MLAISWAADGFWRRAQLHGVCLLLNTWDIALVITVAKRSFPVLGIPTHTRVIILYHIFNCNSSICLWLYSPLLDLGRFFFQLLNPVHSRQDSLDGGSAHRKAATYTHRTTQTQNKRTLAPMPRVGFEPTIPVFEQAKIRISCLKLRGHCDRHCNK
jgi:hypothetical protein